MFKAPFSFDGRIRRIEYFLSGIVGGIVTWIAMLLGVGTFIFGASSGSAGGSVFGLLIGLAALVASVWFSLAQGVKRLHDLNKSGWLILLMFIPIVNAIFGLYMLFADGTVGPNQYGADPKNRMPYQGQPSAVNVTVNVSREDVKVEKPVEAAPAPAETPAEEKPGESIEEPVKEDKTDTTENTEQAAEGTDGENNLTSGSAAEAEQPAVEETSTNNNGASSISDYSE